MSERESVVVMASQFPEVSQTFVVDHVRGLANHGWRVHVAARAVDKAGLAEAGLNDVVAEVHELDAPSRHQPIARLSRMVKTSGWRRAHLLRSVSMRSAAYFASSLREIVKRVQPAVVHAHFAHNGILASLAVRDLTATIVNFHGYDVLQLPRTEGWRPFAETLKGMHGVVHSEFLESHVSANLDLRLHRVTLGVDPALFQAPSRDAAWSEPINLVTVGRLVPMKGHDIAIAALERLLRVGGEGSFRLVVIGDGPARAELEQQVAELGVSHAVRFLGAQPPGVVAKEMASADILLVPSIPLDGWEESFCRVAVEGMASGLAVIGTRSGGLAETIGDGGEVVQPGDPGELSKTVLDLIEVATPEQLAGRARGQAARFDIQRMWAEYDRVTTKVAAGR